MKNKGLFLKRSFMAIVFCVVLALSCISVSAATVKIAENITTPESGPAGTYISQNYILDFVEGSEDSTFTEAGVWMYPGDTLTIKPETNIIPGEDGETESYFVGLIDCLDEDLKEHLEINSSVLYGGIGENYRQAYFVQKLTVKGDKPVYVYLDGSGSYASDNGVAYYGRELKAFYTDEFIQVTYSYEYYNKKWYTVDSSNIAYYGNSALPTALYAVDSVKEYDYDGTGVLQMAQALPHPYAEGLVFTGWSSGDAGYYKLQVTNGEDLDDNYVCWYLSGKDSKDEDTIAELEANFELGQTFTLNAMGGTIDGYATKIYEMAATIEASGSSLSAYVPVREGYTFEGWYIDEEYTEEAENITDLKQDSSNWRIRRAYAKWKSNTCSHPADQTEIRNAKAATLTAAGYTGDTYCTACGKLISKGSAIASPKTFTLSATAYTYNGKTHKPTVTIKDSNGKLISSANYTVKYVNSADTTVSSPISAGTYKVKVTFKGNYSGTKYISYTIKARTGSTASISYTSKAYTGSTLKPTVTVKNSSGTVLTEGTHYTVSYLNASGSAVTPKSVGTYTVKVTMKGNYSGTITKTYKIIPKTTTIGTPVNASTGVTVKWTRNTSCAGYYIYRSVNGGSYSKVKTITSNATVSWTDTGAKTNGYKYQYKIVAYKTVGETTYRSAASSAKTIYFVSRPAISSITNSGAKKLTVKWGKNSKGTGYQIQYSLKSDFSDAKTATVTSNSTVSKTISSLTKGKTYYVRIRTYKTVGSTKYYSAWSAKKYVKITK